ncbi:MAG TPA: hypothetical protein VMJ90_07900 [Anaerolineales bacterium]|nr:hypothetical protein [Anaerolineales bacterium]
MASKRTAPPQFDPDGYVKIPLNDLVVYSIYFLHRQGSAIAAEDIISACFVLFPRRFSLQKYPQWPDSAAVSRRWSDCKSKGYLRGNAVEGFHLTARGIKRAEKVGKSLRRFIVKAVPAPRPKLKAPAVPLQTVHPDLKARARKYIRTIESSDAYRHYKRKTPLNEYDFRSLLLCTMESPPSTLARNMEHFKEYVRIHDRGDLLTFLESSEAKFSHLLKTTSKPDAKK